MRESEYVSMSVSVCECVCVHVLLRKVSSMPRLLILLVFFLFLFFLTFNIFYPFPHANFPHL